MALVEAWCLDNAETRKPDFDALKAILAKSKNEFPLHCASTVDHSAIVKYLLKTKRYDVNQKNEEGYTPLHMAAMKGVSSVVRSLLRQGADVLIQDNEGNTALHLAIEYSNIKVALVLIESKKCDYSLKNDIGQTPRNVASMYEEMSVIRALDKVCTKSGGRMKRGRTLSRSIPITVCL